MIACSMEKFFEGSLVVLSKRVVNGPSQERYAGSQRDARDHGEQNLKAQIIAGEGETARSALCTSNSSTKCRCGRPDVRFLSFKNGASSLMAGRRCYPGCRLLPMLHGAANQRLMLKLSGGEGERLGGAIMEWWDGDGAARVLAREVNALLLERAAPLNGLLERHGANGTGRRSLPHSMPDCCPPSCATCQERCRN